MPAIIVSEPDLDRTTITSLLDDSQQLGRPARIATESSAASHPFQPVESPGSQGHPAQAVGLHRRLA